MAGSVNKVILVGRLGKDPDIRNMQNGKQVASFSVATSESWKDRNTGEKKERTEWHNVVVFNDGLIERLIAPYMEKGSMIYLEGQLQTRKWQDQSGNDRYSTEVVIQGFNSTITMLGHGSGAAGGGERGSQGGSYQRGGSASSGGSKPSGGFASDLDDDIPF